MQEFDQPHVLTVCLDPAFAEGATPGHDQAGNGEVCGVQISRAFSGTEAIELLRLMRFDLLVTGGSLPDMDLGVFIHRVKTAWPWQRWAMAGIEIVDEDEITARTLGALAVLDHASQWPHVGEIAQSIHQRSVAVRRTQAPAGSSRTADRTQVRSTRRRSVRPGQAAELTSQRTPLPGAIERDRQTA